MAEWTITGIQLTEMDNELANQLEGLALALVALSRY